MSISYQEGPSPQMVRAARNAPYLERDHERDLTVRWADNKDQQALNTLAHAHIRLVISVAAKFKNYGLPLSDLVQEGHVGLLEAAARFDPAREVRFSTYATWWIRASIQDYILRNWSIVRGGTSSNQKSLFFNLRRLRAQIAKSGPDLNSQEVYQELSRAIGVSVKDVANMDARIGGPDISLNMSVTNEDSDTSERQDFLVSEQPTPHENVTKMIDGERRTKWIADALNVLDERELLIVKKRKLTDTGATLEALGSELGISKERVRQIESRAFEKLKTALVRIEPEMANWAAA